MIRKTGITFIIIFSLLLVVLINYNELLPKLLFVLSILLVCSLIPLGAALIAFNSQQQVFKKVKLVYLIISLLLIFLGLAFKHFQIPSASICLIVGVLWFSFAFSPMQLKYKYYKWLPYSKNKLECFSLSFLDFIGISTLILGRLFKIMHWPFADILSSSGAVIIIAGLLLWNFKFKKEVMRRKEAEDLVKEQYREIKDSIQYALRIQNAILPSTGTVKQHLENSFILYKPKDLVSGDFYWLEQINNIVLFAAIDCTGHGVPGAMVSVVGHNGLNRTVHEFGIFSPAAILDKLTNLVEETFDKNESDVKDGMDISLCALHKASNTLEWAGAYNPLWIIRNGEILETKADKQPIGKYEHRKPFTNHTIQLQKNDTIYIFTDGFADQFSPKDKKLMTRKFKEILLSIQDKNMDHQKSFLDEFHNDWKGDMEQTDDILIIGVRI
jgi:serine phosphatase RsbU (regulator of sigma subunit)